MNNIHKARTSAQSDIQHTQSTICGHHTNLSHKIGYPTFLLEKEVLSLGKQRLSLAKEKKQQHEQTNLNHQTMGKSVCLLTYFTPLSNKLFAQLEHTLLWKIEGYELTAPSYYNTTLAMLPKGSKRPTPNTEKHINVYKT